MKKTLALILTLAMSLAALTGCGSKTETPADTNTDSSAQTETPAEAALSGSVSTNGSTSMEKVIGALSEQFMADNSGVTVTYDPTGSGAGKIKYRTDAREEYINHAIRAVPVDLSSLKVVVDSAEGASFYTSKKALKELAALVVAIHNNPDGTNINANCGSTHMEELQGRVLVEKAQVGLAFDGDADRLLAVDENGKIVDGD